MIGALLDRLLRPFLISLEGAWRHAAGGPGATRVVRPPLGEPVRVEGLDGGGARFRSASGSSVLRRLEARPDRDPRHPAGLPSLPERTCWVTESAAAGRTSLRWPGPWSRAEADEALTATVDDLTARGWRVEERHAVLPALLGRSVRLEGPRGRIRAGTHPWGRGGPVVWLVEERR